MRIVTAFNIEHLNNHFERSSKGETCFSFNEISVKTRPY